LKILANIYGNNPILFVFIALLPILYFPIFYNLDLNPIMMWDESRQAINVYEMVKNGKIFVPHFNQIPDLYNTKPPLLLWLQSTFWLISHNKELALRLPSAIAALFTCLSLIWFMHKWNKRAWLGGIAAILLVSTPGYIDLHCTRTGDYDALLVLFTSCFLMHFYFFVTVHHHKNAYYATLFFSLAFCTKAAAALLFLPGIILFFFINYADTPKLKNYLIAKCFIIFLAFFILFFGIRIYLDPAYLAATWENDFAGRFNKPYDGHQQKWYFYLYLIITKKATAISIFAFFAFILWRNKHQSLKKLTQFLHISCLGFLLAITFAQTKIFWYVCPIYPLLSLLSCLIIHAYFSKIKTNSRLKTLVIQLFILSIILILNYIKIINTVKKPIYFDWEGTGEIYSKSLILQDWYKNKAPEGIITIVHNEHYRPWLAIYANLINQKNKVKKINILHASKTTFIKGNYYLVDEKEKESFFRNQQFLEIDNKNNVILYQYLGN